RKWRRSSGSTTPRGSRTGARSRSPTRRSTTAKQLKPIVVPELIAFAELRGETIGFAVALPDFNVALKHNPSGRVYGLPMILWHARKISRVRILLLGALKEYRHTGVDALMYQWIWEKGTAKGFRWGEGGWVLEDNA